MKDSSQSVPQVLSAPTRKFDYPGIGESADTSAVWCHQIHETEHLATVAQEVNIRVTALFE